MTTTTHTCEGGDDYTDFDGSAEYAECQAPATEHVRYRVLDPMCEEDEQEQVLRCCATHAEGLASHWLVEVYADTLDTLSEGLPVLLRFTSPELGNAERVEPHIFLRAEGDEVDGRLLRFTDNNETYLWDAYRFEGGWVYGSSAEPLELVRVQYECMSGGRAPARQS